MRWWGKVLGFICGYLIAGLWGALLGCWAGHQFDLAVTRAAFTSQFNPGAQLKAVWLQAVFSVMGCLAKADGRVSEQAILQAHQVMLEMGLNKKRQQQAIYFFKQGKALNFDLDGILAQLMHYSQGHSVLLQQFVELQLKVVYNSDGGLSMAKHKLLQHIASYLGFMMFSQYRHSTSHGNYRAAKHSDTHLSAAYAALGISQAASDQEVKTAYRKLMSRYHPDKISGRGETELLKTATVKTQQIKDAYEQIKKSREAKVY